MAIITNGKTRLALPDCYSFNGGAGRSLKVHVKVVRLTPEQIEAWYKIVDLIKKGKKKKVEPNRQLREAFEEKYQQFRDYSEI